MALNCFAKFPADAPLLEKLREKVVLEKTEVPSILIKQGTRVMRNLDMSNRISIHYVRDFRR